MSETKPDNIDVTEWNRWDEKSKQRFLAQLEMKQKQKKVWFCKKGRCCDGMPHDDYDYKHARGDQWPPTGTDWEVWLLKGGRGSGKTRSGAEWIRWLTGFLPQVSIIGPTWSHVRDYMVEGPKSGLLKVFENAKIPVLWEPSKRRLTTPCRCKGEKHTGGHIIQVFTGEEPERLRGPEHYAVWLDEPAHMPLIQAVWDNMQLGLRLGDHPQILCTTTPLPTKWMREIVKEPTTRAVTVSTEKNRENLSKKFLATVQKQYGGTRLGRQELEGEILEDIIGALWNMDMIEYVPTYRVDPDDPTSERPVVTWEDMERVVVAIDPAGTSSKKRDETGIVVVGKLADKFYILGDYSGTYSPKKWAQKAWWAFDTFQADAVVAEKNYGGEMVSHTLETERPNGNIQLVHSRRGKVLRAEPVVALYEQSRVKHAHKMKELEEQMTEWVPDQSDSPDRVDALVHGVIWLSDSDAGPSEAAVPTGRLGENTHRSVIANDERALEAVGIPTPTVQVWSFDELIAPVQRSMFGYTPREEPIPIPGLSGPLRPVEPTDAVTS